MKITKQQLKDAGFYLAIGLMVLWVVGMIIYSPDNTQGQFIKTETDYNQLKDKVEDQAKELNSTLNKLTEKREELAKLKIKMEADNDRVNTKEIDRLTDVLENPVTGQGAVIPIGDEFGKYIIQAVDNLDSDYIVPDKAVSDDEVALVLNSDI